MKRILIPFMFFSASVYADRSGDMKTVAKNCLEEALHNMDYQSDSMAVTLSKVTVQNETANTGSADFTFNLTDKKMPATTNVREGHLMYKFVRRDSWETPNKCAPHDFPYSLKITNFRLER